MRQAIEYTQAGALRNSEDRHDGVIETLNRMGKDGWEAWFMEDLPSGDRDNRFSGQVRIYFRRPFVLFP